MTDTVPSTFTYSSEEEPRLLRPAKEGEIHIWFRKDRTMVLRKLTQWVEWPKGQALKDVLA